MQPVQIPHYVKTWDNRYDNTTFEVGKPDYPTLCTIHCYIGEGMDHAIGLSVKIEFPQYLEQTLLLHFPTKAYLLLFLFHFVQAGNTLKEQDSVIVRNFHPQHVDTWNKRKVNKEKESAVYKLLLHEVPLRQIILDTGFLELLS